MAKESIESFFETAMTERALAEKVAAVAGEEGYDFTAEELLEFGSAQPLSDDDLEDALGSMTGVTRLCPAGK